MRVNRIGDLDKERTILQKVVVIWHILKRTVFHDAHDYKKGIRAKKKKDTENHIKRLETVKGDKLSPKELKEVWNDKKAQFDPKEVLPPNIYNSGQKLKAYWKSQTRIHKWFKLKLVQPILYIGKILLGKSLVKTIPKTKPCEMLDVWDKAFDEAIITWNNVYRPSMGGVDRPKHLKKLIAKLIRSKSSSTLKVFKQFYNTGVANDTSYLMFHNILMFEIWKKMHDKYKDDKNMMHILYNSNRIDDLKYFITQGTFPDWVEVPLNPGLNLKLDIKQLLQSIMNQAITIKQMDVIQRPGDKVPTKKELEEEAKEFADRTTQTTN